VSDLTSFRDHCRRMATEQHRPDCPGRVPGRPYVKPIGCEGCVTDSDRLLFAMLAAEVDAYLTRDAEQDQLL
jgi:hypothetical protein